MKFPDFAYTRPRTLADALATLAAPDDLIPLAGGQSLMPMLAFRLGSPSRLVDIGTLPEIAGVSVSPEGVRIGAGVTHAQIEDGIVPGALGAFLARAASNIAFRAIRNRGTLGGSLAHADPAADWPVIFAGLGAVVHVAGPSGNRRMPVTELIQGRLQTSLARDELITAVVVPDGDRRRFGLHKSVRKAGEFAEAVAIAVAGPQGPEIWVGAVAGTPLRVAAEVDPGEFHTERSVTATASYVSLVRVITAAVPEADPYRLHLAAVAACRAVGQAYRAREALQ